jgi:osmotically-inducible protein OsmY
MHVVERADGRLRAKPYGALRRIKCEYRDGVLTLRGIVSTYYLKQIAQEAVATLDGIERVDNRIDVYEGANTAEGQDFQQDG